MDRYIGLDAHASSCTLAVIDSRGKRLGSSVVDSVRVRGRVHDIPLRLEIRAMASVFASEEAMTPRSSDEDMAQTRTLVGGDYIIAGDDELRSPDDNVVGYNRRHGMVAHLLPANASNAAALEHCDAGNTEQAIANFSSSACGLYGFFKLPMPDNGASSGTFRLETHRHTLKLYHNTTALIQQLSVP